MKYFLILSIQTSRKEEKYEDSKNDEIISKKNSDTSTIIIASTKNDEPIG